MRVRTVALRALIGGVCLTCLSYGDAPDSILSKNQAKVDLFDHAPAANFRSLSSLATETPDGSQIITLYRSAETIDAVESANEVVKFEIGKAQRIASDLARLHAVAVGSCEPADVKEIDSILFKTRTFSEILAQADGELSKSLASMRQNVAAQQPASLKMKEVINRFIVAAHVLGQLRTQAHETGRTVEALGLTLKTADESCKPVPIPHLFAEKAASLKEVVADYPPPTPAIATIHTEESRPSMLIERHHPANANERCRCLAK
jgi:hypothetical protein